MTLRRRLDRLETKCGTRGDIAPNIIIHEAVWREEAASGEAWAKGGELRTTPIFAKVQTSQGWQTVTRHDDETEADFYARAEGATGCEAKNL